MPIRRQDLADKDPVDIADVIQQLPEEEQTLAFLLLPGELESHVFPYLEPDTQQRVITSLGTEEVADLLNNMPPDDRMAMLEGFPDLLIKETVNLLSDKERKIALTLIGYPEKTVGRLMTPYYIQVKPHWTVDQTLRHVKKNGKKAETLTNIYVVDDEFRLVDDVAIGAFLMSEEEQKVNQLMDMNFVALQATDRVEDAIQKFEKYDRTVLPVVTEAGILVGIVTIDDILDQIEKRATEDIQKFGGLEALDLPYVQTSIIEMVRKRAGWLVILFLGEMFTATAMAYFDAEIERAVVLALFVPLIISSGGNSGSQAATLIIRAMALKELRLKDWWYVMKKEIISGLLLGSILGLIGFVRIAIWQQLGFYNYGVYWLFVAASVSLALLFIVMWGTLSGSMVPFVLKWLRLDPATSSAPFVATLVDVTGLIIYFSIAAMFLSGKLL
jgi:magnesium transporter